MGQTGDVRDLSTNAYSGQTNTGNVSTAVMSDHETYTKQLQATTFISFSRCKTLNLYTNAEVNRINLYFLDSWICTGLLILPLRK